MQWALMARPDRGELIRGSGGLRKIRWAGSGLGKRGGLRVIYYWHAARQLFLMLYLYSKAEQGDLTAVQRRGLGKAIEENLK